MRKEEEVTGVSLLDFFYQTKHNSALPQTRSQQIVLDQGRMAMTAEAEKLKNLDQLLDRQ